MNSPKDRRSIRLRGYDYSRSGAYFITVCTQKRACLFGDIIDGEMVLNDAGRVARQCWRDIPAHFPHAELDRFVVMPNHVHGIIVIGDDVVGAKNFSPLRLPGQPRPTGTSKTIGSMVRGFKIGVTKWMRQNTTVHDVWQRNYYEHIVRHEPESNRIRQYIIDNQAKWATDRNYPDVQAGVRAVREPPHPYAEETWMI